MTEEFPTGVSVFGTKLFNNLLSSVYKNVITRKKVCCYVCDRQKALEFKTKIQCSQRTCGTAAGLI